MTRKPIRIKLLVIFNTILFLLFVWIWIQVLGEYAHRLFHSGFSELRTGSDLSDFSSYAINTFYYKNGEVLILPLLVINTIFLISLFRRKMFANINIVVYHLFFVAIQTIFVLFYFGFITYCLQQPSHIMMVSLPCRIPTGVWIINGIIFIIFPTILYLVFHFLIRSSREENTSGN